MFFALPVVLLGLAWTCNARAMDAEAIAASCGPAVVTVVGVRPDTGGTVQGSGCSIGQRWVLTTAHQIDGVSDLVAHFQNGSEQALSVVGVDAEQEVALLQLAEEAPGVALGDVDSLAPGAPLVAITAPMQLDFSVTEGVVSHTNRAYRGARALQTTLPASAGSSGGPVFDRNGALVGIVLGKLRDVSGATIVIPINNAYPLLQAQGIAVNPAVAPDEETAVVPAADLRPDEREALETYNAGVQSTTPESKIDSYRRATELLPAFFEAWFNLGAAYAATGQHEPALRAYEQAASLRPSEAATWRNLGHSLLALDRAEEATLPLAKAVTLRPEDPSTLNDCGESLRRAGRYDEAEEAFKRALAVDLNYAAAWYNLALVHAQQGQDEQAAQCLQRYVMASPGATDIAQINEWIALLEGDRKEDTVE
jgi:Flp pilus assembly protein TadD